MVSQCGSQNTIVGNMVCFRTHNECWVKYFSQVSDVHFGVFTFWSVFLLNEVQISPAEFWRWNETPTQLDGSGNARSCYVRKQDFVHQSPPGLTLLLNVLIITIIFQRWCCVSGVRGMADHRGRIPMLTTWGFHFNILTWHMRLCFRMKPFISDITWCKLLVWWYYNKF